MDVSDYTQPLSKVISQEHKRRSIPLKVADQKELFNEWLRINPQAAREIEYTAIAIDKRGMRVSAKYLIERQRYEGHVKLNPVTFYDDFGNKHTYGINNSITPLIARWLLEKHPTMNIVTRNSYFDEKGQL